MTTMLAPETERSTNDLGLPPPRAFELVDGDRAVGWITGPTIGFLGFGSAIEAAHAAWVAHRTIARRRARREGRRPIPIDTEPLSLALRGREEIVLASGRRIATLVRPAEGSPSGAGSFGFEIRVPPPAHDVRAIAHLVYRTLRKSGVRWTMWQPDAARLTTDAAMRDSPTAPVAERAPRRPASPVARPAARVGAPRDPSASTVARGDTQPGGESHAIRHSRRRPWWRPTLPWRRAGGVGHGAERGAPGVRR
jgi:hypothetical protein